MSDQKQILSLSSKKTTERIRHDFTEDELSIRKTEVSENMIKHYQFKDELQEIKDDYKIKMQPLEKRNKNLLRDIKQRYEDIDMEVYNVADDDKNMIEFYDATGVKVGERKMTAEERLPQSFKQTCFTVS